jgi:DinB superfamily
MDVRELMEDFFGRVDENVHAVLDGLSTDQLAATPAPGTNPIGWLVWHLTRVQDGHITELLGGQEVWETGPWARRFGLDNDPKNTGYGHTPEEVAEVRADSADALTGYYDAVRARTTQFLADIEPAGLDRVVDTRWDPPVTLGVRLVSIADDCIQHVGQAAYVRGLLERG